MFGKFSVHGCHHGGLGEEHSTLVHRFIEGQTPGLQRHPTAEPNNFRSCITSPDAISDTVLTSFPLFPFPPGIVKQDHLRWHDNYCSQL